VTTTPLPPVVDEPTWRRQLDELRAREKAATRELDAFVVVTQGPIEEALAYKRRVGNAMDWYSTADSSFGSDMGAPPGGGFAVNVFLRDGQTVYRTWHTDGRGCEQLSHTFPLLDLLPYGRQEEWQDVPVGWPQAPTYSHWWSSERFARYGEPADR